jgi:hypothetical protein
MNKPATPFAETPWRSFTPEMLGAAGAVPTMLAQEEQLFYYWLTRVWARGDGAVVDLGCFVGGSTARLAEGHRAAGLVGLIHAYDERIKKKILYSAGIEPFEGEDTLPLAVRLLEPWTRAIELHPGPIEHQSWEGGPIELLVMDASKVVAHMDRMAEIFFPSLIPGRSLVVQQDYLHWANPWIAIQMARMRKWFKPVAHARKDTVAFLCIAPVGEEALAAGRVGDLTDVAMRQALFAARRHMRALGVAEGVKALIRVQKANPGVRSAHQLRRPGR